MKEKKYPFVVIGAGAGGLVVAIGLAKAKKKVLLIEKAHYGGDCTNFGCIPSKSLIAAAEYAHNIKLSSQMGITLENTQFNADLALERVRNIVASVKAHEDEEALKKLHVDALTGTASFIDPHTLRVIDKENTEWKIKSKNIIIATGSSPYVPPIDGLKDTPYLTNETVFHLKKIPKRMIVLGGGPIGTELTQAFNRLGAEVFLVHKNKKLLARESEKAGKILEETFQKEGIKLFLDFQTQRVSFSNEVFQNEINNGDRIETIEAEALLVSAGRHANLNDLHLENANIYAHEKGIEVDKYGRTSQKHIFAIGDIAGPPFFTHLAENRARSVLTTLLLPGPLKKKIDLKQVVPRVTYTDPEIASAGLLEEDAIQKYGSNKIATYTVPFEEVDRAVTQNCQDGFITIVTKKWSSKILGVSIVGPRAGEMIGEILLAIRENIPLRKLISLIHPYPTYLQAIRKAADMWLTKTIFKNVTKQR